MKNIKKLFTIATFFTTVASYAQFPFVKPTETLGIGLVYLSEPQNPTNRVELYETEKLEKRTEEFRLFQVNNLLHPKIYKAEHGVCYFICVKKGKEYYKILKNYNQTRYIPANEKLIFISWENLLKRTPFERKDKKKNPIKKDPNDQSETVNITLEDKYLNVTEMKGEWIKVSFTGKTAWTRWRKGKELLVDLYLLEK